MKLAILAAETSTPEHFPIPEEKLRIRFAVGKKVTVRL